MLNRLLSTGAAGQLGSMLREKLRGRAATLRLSDVADLGEAREGVDHAGAGHSEARLRASREIAGRVRRVARGLLVTHANVGNPRLLRLGSDTLHRETHDAKHVVDALLLERPGHEGCTSYSTHILVLVRFVKGVNYQTRARLAMPQTPGCADPL